MGDTRKSGSGNPAAPTPRRQGDSPGAGKGGVNRGHMSGGGFPGSGANRPIKETGSATSNDGTTQGLKVQRTRISGSQDPRDTHS